MDEQDFSITIGAIQLPCEVNQSVDWETWCHAEGSDRGKKTLLYYESRARLWQSDFPQHGQPKTTVAVILECAGEGVF